MNSQWTLGIGLGLVLSGTMYISIAYALNDVKLRWAGVGLSLAGMALLFAQGLANAF